MSDACQKTQRGDQPGDPLALAASAAPFGTYRLPAAMERLRAATTSLPQNWIGRRLSSAVRRLCILVRAGPFDVEVFPAEFARLHPRDNRCEKRALCGVQFWDYDERHFLRDMITHTKEGHRFVFIDAGANVGLYSLFARSVARELCKGFQMLAVEPDQTNACRLAFNLAQNDYGRVDIATVALGGTHGNAKLSRVTKNRGEIHIDDMETDEAAPSSAHVALLPLAHLLVDRDIGHVDVLKIDIEGYEEVVLRSFFETAAPTLWPRAILMETNDTKTVSPAVQICFDVGYSLCAWTHMNALLKRQDAAERAPGQNGSDHV